MFRTKATTKQVVALSQFWLHLARNAYILAQTRIVRRMGGVRRYRSIYDTRPPYPVIFWKKLIGMMRLYTPLDVMMEIFKLNGQANQIYGYGLVHA